MSLEEWQAWKLGASIVWGSISNIEPSTPTTQGTREGCYHPSLWQGKKQKQAIGGLCEPLTNFTQLKYFIELEWVNKVAKMSSDVLVKRLLCYAKEMLLSIMVQSAWWTMTINIVSSTTVLSVDNSAVTWIFLSLLYLDFIAIEILHPTAEYTTEIMMCISCIIMAHHLHTHTHSFILVPLTGIDVETLGGGVNMDNILCNIVL